MKVTDKIRAKVCRRANNLVKEGYSKAAAFVKAWVLVKLEQVKIRVSGVTYGQRQKALEHLKKYKAEDISIQLIHDSNNKYDRNAVQVIATVKNKGSYCMGYLPRRLAMFIAPLLTCGDTVTALYSKVAVKDVSLPYGLEIAVRT